MESAVQFQHNTPPESVLNTDNGRINRVQDRREKDIIIGGLLTIHNDAAGSAGSKCGNKIWGHGIEILEAIFYSLDHINSDPDLLPNIILGYDIRDTCQSENIALDESANLLFPNNDAKSYSCKGKYRNASNLTPVAATIGPVESFVTVPVASFFRLFHMPQITFASTSTVLSNRNQYGYLFRTSPPDNVQAQAIIDLILFYKWDHVSTIYSNNLYGEPFNNELQHLARLNAICIDISAPIRDNFKKSDYQSLAKKLVSNTTANVVVILAATDHTTSFIQEVKNVMERNGQMRRFIWIACGTSFEPAVAFSNFVAGMWGMSPFSEPDLSFQEYFLQLTTASNRRNPWYTEYHEQYNSTTDNYVQFTLVPQVIDAVYSIAHAMHAFLMENCKQPVVWLANNQTCIGQKQDFSGKKLRYYRENVNFTSFTGYMVNFNNGNSEGRYKIENYQLQNDDIY